MEILIIALLPIVITLGLGFFAGKHHDFSADQAGVLNRMVMLYALPLNLFAGIMSTSHSQLFSSLPLFGWLSLGMVGGYFLVFFLSRYIFRRSTAEAALQALAIAGPAVPFVGVSVLGTLFETESSMAIAICSLLMNIVQVPITLILLSSAQSSKNGGQPTKQNPIVILKNNIVSACKEPIVWAPVLAFVLISFGLQLPDSLQSSLTLLGKSTGGVALFASGIILFSQKVTINKTIGFNVLAKNIILPAIVGGLMYFMHTPNNISHITLLSLAIPTASIAVILAVQYKTSEQEISSTLFFSTILSIVTMGLFIILLGN